MAFGAGFGGILRCRIRPAIFLPRQRQCGVSICPPKTTPNPPEHQGISHCGSLPKTLQARPSFQPVSTSVKCLSQQIPLPVLLEHNFGRRLPRCSVEPALKVRGKRHVPPGYPGSSPSANRNSRLQSSCSIGIRSPWSEYGGLQHRRSQNFSSAIEGRPVLGYGLSC